MTDKSCKLALVLLLSLSTGCAAGGAAGSGAGSGGMGGSAGEDVGDLSTLMCPEGPEWEVDGSTERPEPLNSQEFSRRLGQEYRGPRVPGNTMRALVAARVTRGGTIDQVCIVESSGIPQFDRSAAIATLGLRYRPATTQGEPRSVSVQFQAVMPVAR